MELDKRIEKIVKNARKRLCKIRFYKMLLLFIIIGLTVWGILQTIALIVPFYEASIIGIIACMVLVIAGVIVAICSYPNMKQAALSLDSKGLKERVTTSMQLRGKKDVFSQIQKKDTLEKAEKISIRKAFPYNIKKILFLFLFLSAMYVLTTAMIPAKAKEIAHENHILKQEVKTAEEELEELVAEIKETHNLSVEEIQKLEDILEEGSKYDQFNQIILTNGLLLNERLLEKIAKANVSLIIAIDAAKKATYEYLRRGASWDKLCKNLELIKEINKNLKEKENKRIHTVFNAVISKSNYKEMFEMVDMAKKYDFTSIKFMQILGDSNENIFLNKDLEAIEYIFQAVPLLKQKAEEYSLGFESLLPTKERPLYKDINLRTVKDDNYDLIKTNYNIVKCVAPWRRVVLDSKGPMRTCVSSNDWLGNSKDQTITEFWNSKEMQFYRKKFGEMYSCSGGFSLLEETTPPCWSDINLKENIEKVDRIDGYNIYKFNYKDGYDLPKGIRAGVMAQEVKEINPKAVVYNYKNKGFMAVYYSKLPLAVQNKINEINATLLG